jgi:hypothetical protein
MRLVLTVGRMRPVAAQMHLVKAVRMHQEEVQMRLVLLVVPRPWLQG